MINMKKTFKKVLALFLCMWMLCTVGVIAFAANEEPYVVPALLELDAKELSMVYGGTAQLTAKVYPAGASQSVKWTSSDAKLVTVDQTGKLTAAKDTAETPSGKKTVTITATSTEDKYVTASCTVTVDNDSATKAKTIFTSILNAIKTLFNTFKDPALKFFSSMIELVKKLLEAAPKTEA